jgi:hypothetical protein
MGVENKLDGSVQEFGDGNDLRVGLHVRGFTMPFGSTLSESFVNNVSPVQLLRAHHRGVRGRPARPSPTVEAAGLRADELYALVR